MNNPAGKVNIFLTIAISVVFILIGVLIYQTFLNYKGLLEDQIEEGLTKEDVEVEEEEEKELVYLEPARALSEKSIVIVVAPEDLQSEEYLKIRQIFWAAGAKTETASTSEDLNPDDFDAVVFIEEETTALIGEEVVNIKDSAGPEDFAMKIVERLTGI